MTYKIEVMTDDSGRWTGNQRVFETKEEAREAAKDLMWRWTLVVRWRTVEIGTNNVMEEGGL